MSDDATRTGRRRFLRLAVAVGVGVGLPAVAGAATARRVAWERRFDYGDRASVANDVAAARDGGYVVAGFAMADLTDADAWVAKLGGDGDVEWNRTYDADPDEGYVHGYRNAVAELPDGYVVADTAEDTAGVRLLRLDAGGDVLRSRRFDRTGTSGDREVDVVAVSGADGGDPDGCVVLASDFGDDGDAWLLRFEADLSPRWKRVYGADASLEPAGLVRTADGGYAVAATATTGGDGNLWLGRTDGCGNPCWSRTYADADGSVTAAAVAERRRDGRTAGYALVGTVGTVRSASGRAIRAVTTAPDGTVRAARTFDFGRDGEAGDVVATDAGYAVAATASPQEEGRDLLLVSVDDELDVAWSEYYGRTQGYDYIENAAAATHADGEYGLAGTYLSGGDFGTADGYVVNVVENA